MSERGAVARSRRALRGSRARIEEPQLSASRWISISACPVTNRGGTSRSRKSLKWSLSKGRMPITQKRKRKSGITFNRKEDAATREEAGTLLCSASVQLDGLLVLE